MEPKMFEHDYWMPAKQGNRWGKTQGGHFLSSSGIKLTSTWGSNYPHKLYMPYSAIRELVERS